MNINISTWTDPLAQSFFVNEKGGLFLTSLDLFFFSKSDTTPVSIQIREMHSGYPSATVLPFSEVTLDPVDVNVHAVDADPDPTIATTFTFPSPVYLNEGTEYAIVILANSNDYFLWYAVAGENEYGTETRINKAPYAGTLFSSQNASTWAPDVHRDLKFTLRRARFNTAVEGSLRLSNDAPPLKGLRKDPITTTNGSSIIKVKHPNHGFMNPNAQIPSYVTLSGFDDVTLYNGITGSVLNNTHEIISVEMDSYKIDLAGLATGGEVDVATDSGIVGGYGILATSQLMYTTLQANIGSLSFPGAQLSLSYRGTSGAALTDSSSAPYTKEVDFINLVNGKNEELKYLKVIATPDNEALIGSSSIDFQLNMTSARDNISPVVDLQRVSATTIYNRIDNPGATATGSLNLVEGFIDETAASGGSAQAKYITKVVTLNQPSTTIRSYLSVNRPYSSYIDVYYRADITADQVTQKAWTAVSPVSAIPITDDASKYNEVVFDIDHGGDFNVFQMKIVLRSLNPANVPKCRELRAIALA